MAEVGADAYVASALDDVAWLLNVRGNDVPCLPVVEAYCVVHSAARGSAVELFVHPGVVGDGDAALALGVTSVRDIGNIAERVRELAESEGCALWTDPAQTSMALTDAAGPRAIMLPSPLHRMKAIKCSEEIAGMRQAHVLDGIATIRWLARLEAAAAAGESMSEFGVTMELEKLRGELDGYAGPSFETIAGFGPNGAIIHYEPHQKGSAQVDRSSLLLLDFGGQYLCGGTTDTSRTIHLGEPTAEQRRHYTIVLKSHIALATAVFPAETSPAVLDSIAREVMWRHGLDYRHGTGHGVGALLSVHELPVLNGSRTEPRIDAGMTITMEPGLYLEGKYGIRIENVGLVVESRHKRLDSKKAFLEFEMLTAVPYAAKLIDTKLLTADEIRFVNDYHRRVASEMAPLLSHDPVALSWLLRETSPIA